MTPISPPSSPRPSRRGTTLIEAVAGLALLGLLLSGLLLARARHLHRAADAARALRANRAADALLSAWWRNPPTLPRSASGSVPDDPALAWRTTVIPNGPLAQLSCDCVRLEITSAGQPDPLASVDVALPKGDADAHPLRLHAH